MLYYRKGKAREAAAPHNNISVLQSNSRQLLRVAGGYFFVLKNLIKQTDKGSNERTEKISPDM